MIRLEMKNYNAILTEKQLKYQPYHQVKFITCEEILPSNKQRTIEQAKFTYSPLGKAFEKQIKTIEDQGQNQVEALKPKPINSKFDDNLSISKEIYDKLLHERIDEILKMSRKINYNNLVFIFKHSSTPISFTNFGGLMYTYNQLKNGEKTLQQVEKEQGDFKKGLGEITSGKSKT